MNTDPLVDCRDDMKHIITKTTFLSSGDHHKSYFENAKSIVLTHRITLKLHIIEKIKFQVSNTIAFKDFTT